MSTIERYNRLALVYDRWYDNNSALFHAECAAIRPYITPGRTVEVGCGSGRFSQALAVDLAIEPAPKLRALARARGVTVVDGLAEALPLANDSASTVLLLTVLEFVRDQERALSEAVRVLAPNGRLIVSFLHHGRHRPDMRSPFFEEARWLSPNAIVAWVTRYGLTDLSWSDVAYVDDAWRVRPGRRDALYVVATALKTRSSPSPRSDARRSRHHTDTLRTDRLR